MAAKSLGTLTLDLVAKIGGFTGPLEKAKRTTKKQMGDIAGSAKTAATAIAGIGTVAVGASASVLVLANNAATSAREIKNLAALSNSSIEQFQKYAYAAKSVGIEQDKMGDILKDVNDKVGDFLATGGGELVEFFERVAPSVGITAEAFRGLSGPEALGLFYSALEKANLSQQEMTFYMEAIANDATRLIPLLRDGGAGFSEMADEADRLGIVLSGMDIAKLDEFASQFDRITGILSASGQVIAAELAPYISVLGDYLVESAEAAGGLSVIVQDFIGTSLDGLGVILDAWREFEIAVTTLQWAFKKVEVASDEMANALWQSLAPVFDFYVEQVNILIDGVNALGGSIENLPAYSDTEFLAQFPERVKESKEELWELAWALHDLESSVPPSEMLDKFGEDVVAKVEEIRARLADGENILPPSLGGGGFADKEAAEKAAKEQEKALEAYQSLVAALRTEEEQLTAQMRERLAVLDAVKVSTEEYAEVAGRIAGQATTDAPEYGGLDAVVGGAFGELNKIDEAQEKLEEWYATQLEMLAVFREERADLTETWDAEEQTLKKEHEDELARIEQARQITQLSAAESVFGDLAGMTEQFAGEQSALYKTMFGIQKAAAIAQSIIAIQQGIAMAAANPWPINLGAMASVAAATAGLVSNISSVSMAGMAHDGIDSVPQTGTWLLEKGERVMTSETSAKLDAKLNNLNGGGGAAPIINITHDGSQQATTRERQDGDGRWVIDVLIADAAGDGRFARTQQKTYGLQRKGR